MTSPPPRPPRPGAPGPVRGGPQRRRPLVPVLVGAAVLVLLVSLVASVATEVLWYRQLGFGRVYFTQLAMRSGLFIVAGALMAAAVAVSMVLAYRNRPIYAPVPGSAASLDRYREGLEPLRRVLTVVLPLLLGLFAGSAASSRWETVLLWLHRTSFGQVDPIFNHDIGLYVFTIPFLRFLAGLLTAVVLLAGIAGAVTLYLYGALRVSGPGARTTVAARVQLAVTAAVLVALQAVSYWLDRYSTLTNVHDKFAGASYTDVAVIVPARGILAIAALICAVLFIVTAVRGGWRFPAVGVGLLVVVAVVAAGIVPAVVQRLQVAPNEPQAEAPYIQHNIAATRAAFGLDKTLVEPYTPNTEGEAGALRSDAVTTASTRILDPAVVSPTFAQNQQVRGFYQFPAPLDVDRYTINGQSQDVVVAVRELRASGISNTSWVNTRTAYTHGYGLVAAAGNDKQSNGEPVYLEGGIPASGSLPDYEPRIYFGEKSPEYSIVGGPPGSNQEIDYPDDTQPNGVARYTYTGDGGPSVGNIVERALYAIKFRDANILLSSAVNPQSQILYDRSPRERVQKVAPFLTLDGDPFPTIVNGRVLWVVDGYTTSAEYPYSQPQVLQEATADTLTTPAGTVAALPPNQVNYLRNSVKATVDAYSGEVVLYAWDESDPVLRAWDGAFPGAVKPLADMSGELMSHVRYPEDLFKVQRTVMASYHVTDPGAFYSQNDFWRVPADPTSGPQAAAGTATATAAAASPQSPAQPPYYLTLQMPNQPQASFSLTSTFIPSNRQGEAARNILTGFLAVDADAGSAAGQKRDGYGQLRLLQLPTEGTVNGPGQIQNEFNTNPEVGSFLNLLRQGGSSVRYGNLLTLPVGGGLLYVEPVYVQSTGETAYPTLRKVLVAFGDNIGFADTLDQALDQVFGGDSGVEAPDAGTGGESVPGTPGAGGTPGQTPSQSPSASSGQSPSSSSSSPPTGGATTAPLPESVRQALEQAVAAEADAQRALQQGDFAAYGQAQDRLKQALDQAVKAEQATTASPTPTG
ncbi:hypothetical protein SAMN06264364_10558 [Quadrisphaera granulorum]|uniref:UPF0182 protein BXY45_10558 n=1 Tax=Quadrisphaera granulorum TaxID=317664 RepID=A0A316AD93_9ACTN|nr:UPF0182 family protein [Quadrisphaera granulorum]PWJ54854.1 hypothetical protein BXY45_10558 [Quadrisphaera granulorum]SZE95800.1 hypothetical protein SAMN06264364_10558 [Quadrisphaera granulorum]